ncbi:proteinase-activated receptor 1-like [Hypanus sabinus]|uniref:proteinase-activated receptor 1-like n=1 Tax=Hypanus sabinus TaxID=79690 RepID=UPI0028C41244|nr:proteinase-activated receptor 1-like [Hypanus sabinus]
MSWKVQLVLWIVLVTVVSALQPEKNSSSQSNFSPRTFSGTQICNFVKCNSSQQKMSRQGFNGNCSKNSRSYEAVEVSETTRQYLTSVWMTLVIPFVYTFVFTASLPLNLLAILIFLFKIGFRNPTVIYMTNLAVADLLFVLLLPPKISYHFLGNDWEFGSFVCRLVTGSFYTYMYCSVLLMMCISIDRFLAVVYPIKSSTWRTQRRVVALCLIMWLLAICGAMPFFLAEQAVYVIDLNITTCHDVLPLSVLQRYSVYYVPSLCIVFFVIPLTVTAVCYASIISTLHSQSIVNQYGKRHAFFLAIIVLSVFVVCFTPTNIILLIHYLHFSQGPSDSLYFVYILCVCVGSVSCCLDPLIYYYASSMFQKQLRHILHSVKVESFQVRELMNKMETSTPHP